jgi:hypothetical protein
MATPARTPVNGYKAVTCSACGEVHMVNPKTGKVLGPMKRPTTRCVT